jgi:hypothetical protein
MRARTRRFESEPPGEPPSGGTRRRKTTTGLAVVRTVVIACGLLWGTPDTATAGPPFLTDDPEPVPYRHYEMYVFSTIDHSREARFAQFPAFEFNAGAAPNLQLHVVVPSGYAAPHGGYGIGDIEVGAKYRLIEEAAWRPQAGVFPLIEIPTGNATTGTGNGAVRTRLPVWLQKGVGPWLTYGGLGYQINRARGKQNSTFAGWLLQRKLSERLTLGGEVYHSGVEEPGGRPSTFLDAGAYVSVRNRLTILLMAGHTQGGDERSVGYAGLYYTWGPQHVDGGPARPAAGSNLHPGLRPWS